MVGIQQGYTFVSACLVLMLPPVRLLSRVSALDEGGVLGVLLRPHTYIYKISGIYIIFWGFY